MAKKQQKKQMYRFTLFEQTLINLYHVDRKELRQVVARMTKEKKFHFIRSVLALVFAIAHSDGEFSQAEEKQMITPLLASLENELLKEQMVILQDFSKNIPSLSDCIEYIQKVRSRNKYKIYDTILENIARSDGVFCIQEKDFFDKFRFETGRIKNVPVVATMSSGKSTLINAILSSNLLPSENQACTATIFKIEHSPRLQSSYMRHTTVIEGVSEWESISIDQLKEWNKQDTLEVELLTNAIGSSKSELHTVFYDTPGPNNSMDMSHSDITYSILNKGNFGQIIIVLNAEQFGINDEYDFLENLFELSQKSPQTEFVFVLNKIDSLDPEKENLIEFYASVKQYIEKIGFINPIILPTMSKLALDVRTVLYHADTLATWSSRKINSLLTSLENLEHHKHFYEEVLMYSPINKEAYQNLKKQIKSSRKDINVFLGQQELTPEKLRFLELLTGISILEKVFIRI